MKFMPRSQVIWGGDTCDSFCRREKDEKCSDYTAAAAAAAGGDLLMRGRLLLRSKRPNCLQLIKTSEDILSAPNICFLWWWPLHICRTFMTKFFIGFCICLCDTLCVWHFVCVTHTLKPTHYPQCVLSLLSGQSLVCTCSAVWSETFYLGQHTIQILPWPTVLAQHTV